MTGRALEAGLWAAALAAVAVAYAGWRGAVPRARYAGLPALPAADVPRVIPARVLEDAADSVYENDPFRLEGRPSGVAYGAETEGAPPPAEPTPPKPVLVLKGTVGGPPWAGVLEGVPGREGSVLVRQGDTLGGLRVRRVGRDTVVVTGSDTAWRLTVRRAWQ